MADEQPIWRVATRLRRVPNPIPWLATGGDCGPTAVCCALGWGPERVPEIYRLAEQDPPDGFTWHEMRRLLDVLAWGHRGEVVDWTDRPVVPLPDRHYPGAFGYQTGDLEDAWSHQLRVHLEAGWAALTVVDHDGRGPEIADGDHWVVLAGIRADWVPTGRGGKVLQRSVRVVSSSASDPGDWWVETHEFLRRYGGFRVAYVRPRRRWDVDAWPE